MKKEKGFSFVEMILVLGIAAILFGAIGISIGLVARSNVNKAASELTTALAQARTLSMAKGTLNGKVELTLVGERIYSYVGNTSVPADEKNIVLIGQKPVQMDFVLADGTYKPFSTVGGTVVFNFNQSNGSFGSPSGIASCKAIRLYTDNNQVFIKLYPETGKYVISEAL